LGGAARAGAEYRRESAGRGAGGEKKLYWYTTVGEISVNEQLFWHEGQVLRPFCRVAQVHCRGYSQPLQRRMTDFGADLAFGQVPAKLKAHYGIEVPVRAVRTITEARAQALHAQAPTPSPLPTPAAAWIIAETDGRMIPIVDTAAPEASTRGQDRRKTRQVRWQEAG
jgi:hypothetical protein